MKQCSVEGCEKKHYGHGLCSIHWTRWRKHGDPLAGAKVERPATCTVDGCGRKHKGHGYCQSHLRQMQASGLLGATRACSVDGCDSTDYYAQGLCSRHYQAWRRFGDPLAKTPVMSDQESFAAKYEVDPATDCWNWTGSRDKKAYGRFAVHTTGERGEYGSGARLTRNCSAHRYAYERWVGPIPTDYHVDHMCHNRSCVNPAHLRVTTADENWRSRKAPRKEYPARPLKRPQRFKTNDERFDAKVSKDPRTGCWNWTAKTEQGYGYLAVRVAGGMPYRAVRAHRYAYERWVGPIPANHHVHHVCENPSCVNPGHLVALSVSDHVRLTAKRQDRALAA